MNEMLSTDNTLSVKPWFHEKFQCLFKPRRYKVFYGGRGGLKSWSVARALVLLGAQRPLRVLCAREFQKSIKESVHQLLESQIKMMNLEAFYEIQRDVIRGRKGTSAEGTEFFFIGLHLNSQNVKSYEDVDIVWIEEAANVSGSSWAHLVPTIRKPKGGPFDSGSEIWVTFNPELEDDATYKRFIIDMPQGESQDSFVTKTTYHDNPFLSEAYLRDVARDKEKNYDTYLHVWEGFCKQTLEGAVYADEMREATVQERICKVPYMRDFPISVYFDLGRSDHTSIWFVQQVGYEWHLVDFYENKLKHIDHYLAVLQEREYLYDSLWLPHDAKAKQLGSKMTIEEQCREKFPNLVQRVPRVSIKDKINAARTVFPNCYFDEKRCADGLQHLRHYCYEVNPDTKQFSEKPSHKGGHSDAANAFEYFAVASKIGVRHKDKLREKIKRTLNLGRNKGEFPRQDNFGWMGG